VGPLDRSRRCISRARARGFDARLRTTGDRTWAAGDAVGRVCFTHVAGPQGLTAMAKAPLRTRRSFDHAAVSRVIFTDPMS
jgi:pyruvate/2-oxoglutarate dehydrogenase complex dihydrolipoamide dehydrogenase (E3) component